MNVFLTEHLMCVKRQVRDARTFRIIKDFIQTQNYDEIAAGES